MNFYGDSSWEFVATKNKLKKSQDIIKKLYSGVELTEEEEIYCQELF